MEKSLRTEADSIGEKIIECDVYYGVQTLRGYENFRITGNRADIEFMHNIVKVKKAAARANFNAKTIDEAIFKAIDKACDEALTGLYDNFFITDRIQGGAGTTFNMNVNEVIANRATEILGGKKGEYLCHPNDHVNKSQSTNDVIPTAGKLTVITLYAPLREKLVALIEALDEKAKEFDGVLKMGRTQLQDAVPVRLGQEFGAYASAIKRNLSSLDGAVKKAYTVNLGGTAIGTSINVKKTYLNSVIGALSLVTGYSMRQSDNLLDGTQNVDDFVFISGAVKTLAVTLSKICNDLRLTSSGPKTGLGEISLPAKQNGSSIMPGKVNPVIPEVVNQVAFAVIGNDVTITLAAEAGQLELNAFEPVIFARLFESIKMLTGAVDTLTENCVKGITANVERCKRLADESVGIVTALCPYIGYKKSADLAKEALKTGKNIKELVLFYGYMDEKELDSVLDAVKMTEPRD